MMVYGDPGHETPAGAWLRRLAVRIGQARRGGPDERRTLLIEAGQLEQALADRLGDDPVVKRGEHLTDSAADALLDLADGAGLPEALAAVDPPPALLLRVKLPEGYAFYALFPEQYARAAKLWAGDHSGAPSRRVLVVGIRSIGTGLSAVVARTLGKAGWTAWRMTVRPTGHPYHRRAEIPRSATRDADFALVVDEGPGQSGSSMAAVAEALAEAGLGRSRIGFLPGHNRGPGPEADEAVRDWWRNIPCRAAGLDEPVFGGASLTDTLIGRSGVPVVRVEDLSGGAWRRAVHSDERTWPVAFPAFERSKYRMVRADGSALLWKFEGLAGGAEQCAERMAWLARRGWTVAPLDCACGFTARPWVAGLPLRRQCRDPALLRHMGRYAAAAALPAVPESERRAGLERLREMLYWNVRESLGEAVAERALAREGLPPEHPWPTYGDGRLGPEEWLLRPDGRLVKVDCAGHRTDHTAVGVQPLAWDLAGAMVEWDLDEESARPLLKGFAEAGGERFPVQALAFYRLAYAAFRLGQCVLCAGMADPAERRRLLGARDFYRQQLTRRLAH